MKGYNALEDLWRLVAAIPMGKCISYGELGKALKHPASGFLVGRWMAQCPEGLPWWRVVAKNGRLPIHKRDPRWSELQEDRLKKEGVEFAEGKVIMDKCRWSAE